MSSAEQPSFFLRPAATADCDSIKTVLQSRCVTMPWLPVLHTDAEDRWYIENVVLATQTVTVSESGQSVVGFMALTDGWVEHLYIAPDFQRQGIGRALIAIAKVANPGGLRLWCFQRNDLGRAFYEALGFEIEKSTDGQDNEEKEPDLLFRWTPNSGDLTR